MKFPAFLTPNALVEEACRHNVSNPFSAIDEFTSCNTPLDQIVPQVD
jgi:hypothetical protein